MVADEHELAADAARRDRQARRAGASRPCPPRRPRGPPAPAARPGRRAGRRAAPRCSCSGSRCRPRARRAARRATAAPSTGKPDASQASRAAASANVLPVPALPATTSHGVTVQAEAPHHRPLLAREARARTLAPPRPRRGRRCRRQRSGRARRALDEPLLDARAAPAWSSAARPAGQEAAARRAGGTPPGHALMRDQRDHPRRMRGTGRSRLRASRRRRASRAAARSQICWITSRRVNVDRRCVKPGRRTELVEHALATLLAIGDGRPTRASGRWPSTENPSAAARSRHSPSSVLRGRGPRPSLGASRAPPPRPPARSSSRARRARPRSPPAAG